jgi:hypothetical protein
MGFKLKFHPLPAGTVLYHPAMCASDMKSQSKIELACATVSFYSHDADLGFECIFLHALFHFQLSNEQL